MNTAIIHQESEELISSVVLKGDLSNLNPNQKVAYYRQFCDRLGLDPLTQPFKLLRLNGKEILYCDRSGAQQLNKIHKVSHEITARETVSGCYVVTAQASTPDGRHTESIGAVPIENLKGDNLCNAMMKAETKAKRRATLDLLGLGILDETETETIPNAQKVVTPVNVADDDGTRAPGIGNRKPQKDPSQVTAYNHKQLVKDGKPLISNEQFKNLCDDLKGGKKEAYQIALEAFSFEDEQAKLAKQLYDAALNMTPYKKKYISLEEIGQVLYTATTVQDVATLYYANSDLVETSPELKKDFSTTRDSLFKSHKK